MAQMLLALGGLVLAVIAHTLYERAKERELMRRLKQAGGDAEAWRIAGATCADGCPGVPDAKTILHVTRGRLHTGTRA